MNAEIEFLEVLRKTCRTARSMRERPELAAPAAEWEIKIKARLEELEAQETPELPERKERVAA